MSVKRGYPEAYFTSDVGEPPQAPSDFVYRPAAIPTQELLPYPYYDPDPNFKWLIAAIIALGFFGLLAIIVLKDK